MNKDGYLIARTRKADEFFTSASAYDRAVWKPAATATKYRTVELAESALKKLLRAGNYEARLIPVAEAMEFEMPNDKKKAVLPSDEERAQMDMTGDEADDLETEPPANAEMVAGGEPLDPTDDQVPHEDTSNHSDPERAVDTDINADVDAQLGLPSASSNDPMQRGLNDHSQTAMGDFDGTDAGVEHPELDADGQPIDPVAGLDSEHDEHSDEQEEDPFAKSGSPVREGAIVTQKEPAEKVKVPSEVKSELRAVIADFKKQAKFADTRDDTRASHCLTIVAAFEELADLLSEPTEANIKMAQIKVTSWMSPIRAHLPTSVQKFIAMGGKKPTLKNLFDAKRADKKAI